jgi:hypothetical protein
LAEVEPSLFQIDYATAQRWPRLNGVGRIGRRNNSLPKIRPRRTLHFAREALGRGRGDAMKSLRPRKPKTQATPTLEKQVERLFTIAMNFNERFIALEMAVDRLQKQLQQATDHRSNAATIGPTPE